MKQGIKYSKSLSRSHRWLGLALLGLLVPLPKAMAQQVPQTDSAGRVITRMPALLGDTVRVRLELQPDSLVAVPPVPVDSARLEWLRTPPTVRELVCDRMGCFETDVPHQFNNSVMAYVTLFTARNRSYMQRVLERENFYFPIFEKYLAKYNLPIDLKYLAVVESALIPTAKSPVGATGLWQFMGPTAGDLNLKRDEWIDERMAPEKATEAACKHLRYLYGIFHDWELVLAAYNWGAGSVQRVMRRTGKKTFWDLYPYMPAETRNYVPTFTAIMYSMKYAEAHGLRTDKLHYQYAESMDTLGLRGYAFDLRRLSQACGYDDSLYLTRFNPELRRAALPAGYRPYVVRFPAAAAAHLGDVDRNTLLTYCQPTAELPRPLAPMPPRLDGVEPWITREMLAATEGPRTEEATAAPRFRRVPHKVRRGETLASLAERFEVSQTQLRRWNELPKGRPLKPGKQLVIFVPLPAAAPRRAPAAPVATETLPMIAAAPHPVHSTVSVEEAAARKEQAAENAREVARLQEITRQEKVQEARLLAIRQRQAIQQAAAEVQARATARRLAQAQAAEAKRNEAKAAAVAAVLEEAEEPVETAVVAPVENGPYTVRKGDNLTKLAREHNLSVAQIVAWNKLESEAVVLGQRLVFRAPADAEEAVETSRKQPKATAKVVAAAPRTTADKRLETPKVHLVQPGDTLFNISRRFNVSVQMLRDLNHLKSDEVKLGQKLLVPQS